MIYLIPTIQINEIDFVFAERELTLIILEFRFKLTVPRRVNCFFLNDFCDFNHPTKNKNIIFLYQK